MARPHLKLPIFTEEESARFWSKVSKGEPDQCWPWQGSKTKEGYGHFYVRGQTKATGRAFRANRIAYFLHYGVDPGSSLGCHSCDFPPCCNPAHVFAGTNSDNSNDMKQKRRAASGDRNTSRLYPERRARGEKHGKARFTDSQIREMKKLYDTGKFTYAQIGDRFNANARTVWRLINDQGRVAVN